MAVLHGIAFLYDGALHDLGTLGGGTDSAGRDINASGQVTGSADAIEVSSFHAFLWTPTTPNGATGTMHDLGTLGGPSSDGRDINDSGQVTGRSETTAGLRAFLYDGTMHDLGTLGGNSSEGYGINASGQVTGYSETTVALHAFLYTSGSGMVDLNSLIDPLSGWELQFGYGINDSGQITGSGLIGGETHAFLLSPVPEPATWMLFCLGLVAVAVRGVCSVRPGSSRHAVV